jgi:hypothetical protein
MLYVAPVAVIAGYGAWWIAAHAGAGRAATHTLWQSLTLAEVTVVLLLRGHKPAGALAGILAAYLIFDLPWLTLPPMLFALLTVAAVRGRRTVAAVRGRGRGGDRGRALPARWQGQLRRLHPRPAGGGRGRGRRGHVPETGTCPCRRPGSDIKRISATHEPGPDLPPTVARIEPASSYRRPVSRRRT